MALIAVDGDFGYFIDIIEKLYIVPVFGPKLNNL